MIGTYFLEERLVYNCKKFFDLLINTGYILSLQKDLYKRLTAENDDVKVSVIEFDAVVWDYSVEATLVREAHL